jgi:plastocyanin
VTRGAAIGLLLVVGLLAQASPAAAGAQQVTLRYGPIHLSPYELKRGDVTYGVPTPQRDGFITAMEAEVVDGAGRPVPIQRVMLHHVVFLNAGARLGERRDPTCDRYTLFDSESQLPALAERFFGVGEEREKLILPPGHGYPVRAADRWAMTWMLMSHRSRRDTVYIQYKVTVDDSPALAPVRPLWLDVRNCKVDPVFDVPGGGRRGSTYSQSTTWTVPETGRLVAGVGHVHGGGRSVVLSQPRCGERVLFDSRPLWGARDHPYYRVRPLLHEPGPISMSQFSSGLGIPVAAGEQLRLTASYDNRLPHTRVMGIMVLGFVPDAGADTRCASPLPSDFRRFWLERAGRTATPQVRVPINGFPAGNRPADRARAIRRPPGRTVELRSGSTIEVDDLYFGPANAAIRRGGLLRWRFLGDTLHNVTLANGPRGFSSANLSRDREFRYRFRKPGTYRLYCGLHPVSMTSTVAVGRR